MFLIIKQVVDRISTCFPKIFRIFVFYETQLIKIRMIVYNYKPFEVFNYRFIFFLSTIVILFGLFES